ncbi:discoidin domain-containing protein, partial [Xanthomonas sacchari]
MTAPVQAQDGRLPPRAQWQASSSSKQVKAQAIGYLIDGDASTRTAGAFSPGHWFQIDLGRAAQVGGVRLQWDTSNPEGFLLQTSRDGQRWDTVYTMADSLGGTETVFFAPHLARYLRLAAPARSADWGVSIYEMQPLGADAAQLRGVSAADAAALWQGGAAVAMPGKGAQARQLDIAFPRAFDSAGLIVEFAGAHGAAQLQAQDAAGRWRTLADDPQAGDSDSAYLAGTAPLPVRALRLRVDAAPGGVAPTLARLRLLGPKAVMTPMKRYQVAAQRGATRALFPASLHMQQTYWTAVGIHAGRQKSIFDEYGNLEAWKGAPLVQPLWRDVSGTAAGADGHALTHALRDGWKPMPSVRWSPQPGLELRSETFAIERGGQPVTLLRHRLRNIGTTPVSGTLSLLVRPMQMNPPWQNGGLSPIHDIAVDGGTVQIDGRALLTSLSTPSGGGAEAFGTNGATEITRHVVAGTLPAQQQAHDADGLAAAMLNYTVRLAPGAQQDVVLAFPLGTASADAQGRLPPA